MEIELDIKFENYSPSGSFTGPLIIKNKTTLAFGTQIIGFTGLSKTFTVKGLNLTGNLVITAPAGFIINTNNSNTNQSPINLVPSSGYVLTTTIYVKFVPLAGANYSGDISMTSPGAITRTISLTGTGVVDVAPIYAPAEIFLSQNVPLIGEIGEPYSALLTANFVQNDAGVIAQIKIQKDGSDIDLITGDDELITTDSGFYDSVPIQFRAYADYAAGPLKNYSPSGNIDLRAALVRNINAPQAAEVNFASSIITLTGELYVFYGSSPAAPSDSSDVRILPVKISSSQAVSGVFYYNTLPVYQHHSICIPNARTLVKVIDITAGNVDITASFINNPFTVDDLTGNPNAYKNYTYSPGSTFPFPHQLQITIS